MNQMNNLMYVWISGLSAAVGILTGMLVGGGETEKIRPYARLVQRLFLLVGGFSCAVILLLRGPFLSLYGITEETGALRTSSWGFYPSPLLAPVTRRRAWRGW